MDAAAGPGGPTGADAGAQAGAGNGALGVIAGSGDLPRLIAEDRRRRGLGVFVIRPEGVEAPWADAHPHLDTPFEKAGRLLRALRDAGCDKVCFAGAMTRPKINPLRLDFKAVQLAAKALRLLRKGDDEMLRGFAAMIEAEGFAVVAAHEQLEGLLAPAGAVGRLSPGPRDLEDIARAARIVRALGAVDVGQGAVVAGGQCLGVEAIAGTDALLAQVAELPDALRPDGRPSGALFKAPKPGQDWRVDMPAIGPETIRRAHAAGLSGVALRAGGVLLLGREETAAEADRLGLFVWGLPDDAATP